MGNEEGGRKEKTASECSEHWTRGDCWNLPHPVLCREGPATLGFVQAGVIRRQKPSASLQAGLGACQQREDGEMQRHHLWPLKGKKRKNDERETYTRTYKDVIHLWPL